ncbi:hypothetical protein JTB14_009872 [Gonioctena quinquepunctata]|nr:hypothetical protein JTB14_009872 [Gonioctena quinquepunctata]
MNALQIPSCWVMLKQLNDIVSNYVIVEKTPGEYMKEKLSGLLPTLVAVESDIIFYFCSRKEKSPREIDRNDPKSI